MEHPVFPVVDALGEEYTRLWKDICMRETRSDDFEALNAQTDVLETFGLRHGLLPERISYPAAGDALILTLPASGVSADGAPVALLGHMDTVHENKRPFHLLILFPRTFQRPCFLSRN